VTAAAIPGCTGALLSGGRARRLGGVPKGALRLHGEPLLARALRVLGELFGETLLVGGGPPPPGANARAVEDVIPGRGAPGGLHAALRASPTEWIFLAAWDMPFLAPAPIAWLAAQRAGAPAVAVAWRGRVEPLHAFWSRACLPAVERALARGAPSMAELAEAVGARIVAEGAWRELDPTGRSFANANTPADVARLGLEWPGDPPAR
jgi:molybdopterin-guanine dinucleotide biosynthesis protein A